MAGRTPGPSLLKEWFREIDVSRNGMLDEKELGDFLRKGSPDMEDRQIKIIFHALDKNNDGAIFFDDLVDFVFAPPSASMERSLRRPALVRLDTQTLEAVKTTELSKREMPSLQKVEIFGSSLGAEVDGVYKLSDNDWVVCASAGTSLYDGVFYNGKSAFEDQDKGMKLFFGWTLALPRRLGWFLAEIPPAQGEPVQTYKMFNPSPHAETPDRCSATWELHDGSSDKRLCLEPVEAEKDRGRRYKKSWLGEGWADKCLEGELWPPTESLQVEPDSDDGDLAEEDWDPQDGEQWSEDDYIDEDDVSDISGDGLSDSSEEEDDDDDDDEEFADFGRDRAYTDNTPASGGRPKFGRRKSDNNLGGAVENGNGDNMKRRNSTGDGKVDAPAGKKTGQKKEKKEKREKKEKKEKKNKKDKKEKKEKKEKKDKHGADDGKHKRERMGGGPRRQSAEEKEIQKQLQSERTVVKQAPGFEILSAKIAVRACSPMPSTLTSPRGPEFIGKSPRERAFLEREEVEGKTQKMAQEHKAARKDLPVVVKGGIRIDSSFMPDQSALWPSLAAFKRCNERMRAALEKVDDWLRLTELNKAPCLFHRVMPEDVICDPDAGNFWFMAACAAVAEYPGWVHMVFGRVTELSVRGKYMVRLFHPGRGAFVRVLVDDLVPTIEGRPAFAGITGDGSIWVPLLEKAFAKFTGSYANTAQGEVAFGMHYLCGGSGAERWDRQDRGGPSGWTKTGLHWTSSHAQASGDTGQVSNRYDNETELAGSRVYSADELWIKLRRFMERCYPVVAGPDRTQTTNCNLDASRFYSILGAREVPVKSKRLRMVLLRNPFGARHWTGRWCATSNAWQDNTGVKEMLEFNPDNEDGTFWMSYTDFLKHFLVVHVCKKSMPVQGCNHLKYVGLKRSLGMVTT